jgi:hypothetical protein
MAASFSPSPATQSEALLTLGSSGRFRDSSREEIRGRAVCGSRRGLIPEQGIREPAELIRGDDPELGFLHGGQVAIDHSFNPR